MSKTPPVKISRIASRKGLVNSSDEKQSRPISAAFTGYFIYGGLILMAIYSIIELGRYNQQEDHELSFLPYVAGLIHWTAGFSILSYYAYRDKKILSGIFAVATLITLTLLIQISQLDLHYSASIADQIECQYDWLPNDTGLPGEHSCRSDFKPGWDEIGQNEGSLKDYLDTLWRY